MFNNFFFDGSQAETLFNDFLTNAPNERCCIFTDPPFGCRTEPLVATLRSLCLRYQSINKCRDILSIFWIFPYYMETYITNLMPEMTMVDYKVDYTNHGTYHSNENGRKFGSPVRMFTNVAPNLIELPTEDGYRLCKKCKRWVSCANKHCDRCKCCPSKNGSSYVHCRQCENCTKPSYRHCSTCWRCTQIENHDCTKYQSQLTCMICLRKGHNEANCVKWFEVCKRKPKDVQKLKAKVLKTGQRICFLCFKGSHNERMCPKRNELLNETTFLSQAYNSLCTNSLND